MCASTRPTAISRTCAPRINADQIDLAICPIDILDEGSGLEFQQILPGRNVVACRVTHPLLLKRRPQPAHLLDYPWIAPPPGSPLLADLRSMLLSFGATEIKIRYSGGSLMSVVNYMKAADALTICRTASSLPCARKNRSRRCPSPSRIPSARSAC